MTILLIIIQKQPKRDSKRNIITSVNYFNNADIVEVTDALNYKVNKFHKVANAMTAQRNRDFHPIRIEDVGDNVAKALDYLDKYATNIKRLHVNLTNEAHILRKYDVLKPFLEQAWYGSSEPQTPTA